MQRKRLIFLVTVTLIVHMGTRANLCLFMNYSDTQGPVFAYLVGTKYTAQHNILVTSQRAFLIFCQHFLPDKIVTKYAINEKVHKSREFCLFLLKVESKTLDLQKSPFVKFGLICKFIPITITGKKPFNFLFLALFENVCFISMRYRNFQLSPHPRVVK